MAEAESRCVRLTGLPPATSETQVVALALPFGPVRAVRVGRSKGEAFVTFEDAQDAAAARDNLSGAEVGGMTLGVAFAAEQEHDARKAVWDVAGAAG